jgi:hypothetical protein
MNKNHVAQSVLLMALLGISAAVAAQPSTLPDNATQVPPEMGVKPARPAASAPLPADIKPRIRPQFKPRMKPEELKPDMRPDFRPEMSPGMQPNSQKPLHTDVPVHRGDGPAN